MYLEKFGLEPHASKGCEAGNRFGKLTVLAVGRVPGGYRYKAVVQCDCGSAIKLTSVAGLRRGETIGCGCQQRVSATKHGRWKHPLYRRWRLMIERCYNPNDASFGDYGGRGIQVDDRWRDVDNFINDLAPTFGQNLTLERINNDGNYCPSNVCWATDRAQRRNRRNNIQVTMNGKTQVLSDWCEELGVRYQLAWERIKVQGWDPIRALTAPKCR